jgi:hypothetical protein
MINTVQYPPARLQFLSDWKIIQLGEIKPGKKLVIEYDLGRLPNFRIKWREADIWNVEIYIRFHPGDQLHKGSLLEEVRAGGHGPVIDNLPNPFEIDVPIGATQVELWFRTFDDFRYFREAWDSQFGQNYLFDVVSG